MHTYKLFWAPEGRCIAENVQAETGWDARKQAPMPYRKFIGEIYSVRQDDHRFSGERVKKEDTCQH